MGETLGMPHAQAELMRLYHDDDVLGRCLGLVQEPHDILRRIARSIDPNVLEEDIATALNNRRRRMEHALMNVEPAILEALDRLRDAGMRTALVSDAGFDDVEFWEQSPLADRLDSVVFSYRLGVRKPDRRIYEHALSDIGVAPGDALFVGDGGSDEHRGARALGIRPVLVTRLISHWKPEIIYERRQHVDWEFLDVPAFVDELLSC
jgi:putative hydrolase of the HAD superfamily